LAFPELLRCELKIKHNSSPNRLHGARLLFWKCLFLLSHSNLSWCEDCLINKNVWDLHTWEKTLKMLIISFKIIITNGVHTATCSMGNGGSFPCGKVAGICTCPLISIQCQGQG
jgi:hypothetical protein